MDEVIFSVDGQPIKKISLNTEKGEIYTQVLEIREGRKREPVWFPTHFQIHAAYREARIVYLGLIAQASYENGNGDAIKPNGIDNIYVRGSKPFKWRAK